MACFATATLAWNSTGIDNEPPGRRLWGLSGLRQRVVAQIDPPAGMGFSVKLGATLDLVKSASGQVLLAFAPAREVTALTAQKVEPLRARDALKPRDASFHRIGRF